jgi:hypothetical protein
MTKERPILFSPAMIRALLAGTKVQTRRIMKPHPRGAMMAGHIPVLTIPKRGGGSWLLPNALDQDGCCPYGSPGSRLWVKEGWRPKMAASDLVKVTYMADGDVRSFPLCDLPEWNMPKAAAKGNVTCLFMPRWASRITLEITEVRVQRLQEISAADAQAEGMESCTPYDQYRALWDSINGKTHPWVSSPWVWALSFRVIEPARKP